MNKCEHIASTAYFANSLCDCSNVKPSASAASSSSLSVTLPFLSRSISCMNMHAMQEYSDQSISNYCM